MKGAINYFVELRNVCQEHKGDCKNCPLGKYKDLSDCKCPRLMHPENWTDEKIVEMVRV